MPANRDHRSAEGPDSKDARQDVDARHTGAPSHYTTESHREPVAPWRNGRVARVRRAHGVSVVATKTIIEAIREAMAEEMRRDERVIVLG